MLVAGDLFDRAAFIIEDELAGEFNEPFGSAEGPEQAVLGGGLAPRQGQFLEGLASVGEDGQTVVVATAMNTELGRIARLIEAAGAEQGTPLQQKLDSFGRILVWAALGIVALLFGLDLLRGTKLFELTMTSVSLAVATPVDPA